MSLFPPELIGETLSHLHGQKDKATLKNVREASMTLALLSRKHTFSHITFRGLQHIHEFSALLSAPHATIPSSLQCNTVVVKNIETIDEASLPAVCALLADIRVKHTLGLHITTAGAAPLAATAISAVWGNTLRQLSVCGGTYRAPAFFQLLTSLPQLESLVLRSVAVEDAGPAGVQYSFPPRLRQLSLSRCAPLWNFFHSRVVLGGGLDNVRDLYVQEVFFGGEAGVVNMQECFRRLHTVSTITLDPVYRDDRHPNFNCAPYDIIRRCWEATLLQMQGLRLLRVNCANLPPKFATEYVCMYAIQFSRLLVDKVVEIYAPPSLDLSIPGACEKQLDAAHDSNPPAAVSGRSNLVIRGLPGQLPGGANRSQRVMVCEYPVTFMPTDWEEAMGTRLNGL